MRTDKSDMWKITQSVRDGDENLINLLAIEFREGKKFNVTLQG